MNATYVDFHLGVETVVHDQTVRHPYTVRLHRVPRYVGIIANIGVVEVCDLFWLRCSAARKTV
jgi:hypothetical protein